MSSSMLASPAIPDSSPRADNHSGSKAYEQNVNPQWVKLLNLLDMNAAYTECRGEVLKTANGRKVLDFLSGYCVYNAGHNHPAIVNALRHELELAGPSMLQSHISSTAGELAERLLNLAGGRVKKVYFSTSGSDGVETAIKFSRAAYGEIWVACSARSISRADLRGVGADGFRFLVGRLWCHDSRC